MARSVAYKEHLSMGVRGPILVKALSEASMHILRDIISSLRLALLDEESCLLYVFGKWED